MSKYPVLVTSSSSTNSALYDFYLVDASNGNITLTLEDISNADGMHFILIRKDNGGNSVTIVGTSSQQINGNASETLSPGGEMHITSFSGAWYGNPLYR